MALSLLLLLLSVQHVAANLGSADSIAAQISTLLTEFMGNWFDKSEVTEIYNTQSYDTLTGLDILKLIKRNVTKQFMSSETALSNIRRSALESFYNYTGDRWDFDFLERFRNRTHKDRPISYHQTANFKREVSVTNSSLVLPLDVYFNWTEVRETILWTQNMDSAFKANWSPNLTGSATMLQYIGTPHGVMRVYPSYYTPRIGKWVTYDHRFRIWYAVGAMESNKMVFLMDKSGTLVGEPMKLMREMAINIIKTMISDEDYISVLTFNQKVEPLGCGTQMVRARSRIKTILIEQIRKITPGGAGNLTEAIRSGVQVLNNSKSQETCHSTLVLFTDYTQLDVVQIFRRFNTDPSVKIVILQVSNDIMFARDLSKAAYELNGFYKRIEDLSDISPTILELTSEYTSLVDDDDLQFQVKTTPMYKDASTEEYITTLVLPVVTDKAANWSKPSSLRQDKGSFLGVAAVDIEAKSLGQYPLSTARGCYAITVDLKGSVLYHPVLYRTRESIEIDQKLHLYSYLNDASTMKRVERGMVFQNFTQQEELLYVEVSDSSKSHEMKSFANNYFFNVLVAIEDKTSLLHICNRQSLAFPKRSNVESKLVRDLLPYLGPQTDQTRDTAYCSYSLFTQENFGDAGPDETVAQYIARKLQFSECHDLAYEVFDDIYMVSTYLRRDLEKDARISVTTAAGNRFEMTQGGKLRRTNNKYTRERYTRLISLVTNSRANGTEMLTVSNVTNSNSRREMFELSQVIYHLQSNSYPLMLSIEIPSDDFNRIIEEPFSAYQTKGGSRYLVDENAFVIATDRTEAVGKHLAKLFPKLMQELLRKGIYNFFNHTECYFSCEDVYPKDSALSTSSADMMTRLLQSPSSILAATVNLLRRLLATFWFLIFNPSYLVASMPDSATKFNEDWKSIKINLTCCHIHPFMSRNYSIPVNIGSSLEPDATCTKSYRYTAVPNTNLLFVWAWCTDSLCECDEPSYNLDTIVNSILNPCTESDENYNPTSHCTVTSSSGIRQRNSTAVRVATASWGLLAGSFFILTLRGV